MSVIDWASKSHGRRWRGRWLETMMFTVAGRSCPTMTDVNIEVFVLIVIATHDGGDEGYS